MIAESYYKECVRIKASAKYHSANKFYIENLIQTILPEEINKNFTFTFTKKPTTELHLAKIPRYEGNLLSSTFRDLATFFL